MRRRRAARSRCPRLAVRSQQDREPAPPDWLSGGKSFSRETLSAYELAEPGFGPVTFGAGSVMLPLLAALPTSLGDCFRATSGDATALAVLGANVVLVAVLGVFIRSQVDKRTARLEALARELALGDIRVISTDRFGNEAASTLRKCRGARRFALVYGTKAKLQRDMEAALVYRRRLSASSIMVVPVEAEGAPPPPDTAASGAPQAEAPAGYTMVPTGAAEGGKSWRGQPARAARGQGPAGGAGQDPAEYFRSVLKDQAGAEEGAYITVGIDGRVRGSGTGSPAFDVLLSTFPQQLVDRAGLALEEPPRPSPSAVAEGGREEGEAGAVLQLHREFYAALDAGDEAGMAALWRGPGAVSDALTDYAGRGARLDPWATVLRPDRRPIGMEVTDTDVLISPDGLQAWATCLEKVTNGATLLATQRFSREDGGAKWQLVEHKTIPYGKDIVAKVVLTCDSRGCVALPAKALASSVSARNFKLK